jgi:hypothetical protein
MAGPGTFNVAKGRICELHDRVVTDDPSTSSLLVVALQETTEAAATLKERLTLAAVLAANTEATFDNYTRIEYDQTDLGISTVDTADDVRRTDMPDVVYASAGGGTDNALDTLLVCYVPNSGVSADSAIIPLVFLPFVATTDGNDLTFAVHDDGYYEDGEPA